MRGLSPVRDRKQLLRIARGLAELCLQHSMDEFGRVSVDTRPKHIAGVALRLAAVVVLPARAAFAVVAPAAPAPAAPFMAGLAVILFVISVGRGCGCGSAENAKCDAGCDAAITAGTFARLVNEAR